MPLFTMYQMNEEVDKLANSGSERVVLMIAIGLLDLIQCITCCLLLVSMSSFY